MEVQIAIDLGRLRARLDEVVDAGSEAITEADQDTVGPRMRELLGRIGPHDRLAAIARALPTSDEITALRGIAELDDNAISFIDMQIGLVFMAYDDRTRHAMLAAVLLALLPDPAAGADA